MIYINICGFTFSIVLQLPPIDKYKLYRQVQNEYKTPNKTYTDSPTQLHFTKNILNFDIFGTHFTSKIAK